jgi:two-component system, chemotaxis family, sensor kinase Cph1
VHRRPAPPTADGPAFGQADLSNCERELIHLAGSVQPHGLLLVLSGAERRIVQLTDNAATLIGRAPADCLERPLALLGGDLDDAVAHLAAGAALAEPEPLRGQLVVDGRSCRFDGLLHRLPAGTPGHQLLLLELEPQSPSPGGPEPAALPAQLLQALVGDTLRRFGDAPGLAVLADAAARGVRELTGYDRVMVYRFDPDGHGQVIAESRDPRLDPLLGHRYPATDIPQRARQLYVRQRVRLLVDVHYRPAPLVPALTPPAGSELDMSLCTLRSMSPLHLQYLKNMGVTATLVVSIVVGGQLWGLIAAHHHAPRNLRPALRAAAGLLGEMMATRLSSLEHYAHAEVGLMVRRLEQRLVEATSAEGDWRLALLRHPHMLLQPLEASGAVLFHDGEVLTCGDVPATPELRALRDWVQARAGADVAAGEPFASNAVGRDQPALAALTPLASGVLAVRLADGHAPGGAPAGIGGGGERADWLMWLRKEQLESVTWAGDPHKPVVGDNPLELSPRRSFAAWSEIVRGSARPWSTTELALGRAIGHALVDIIAQVHAVRLLIAEDQLQRTRATLAGLREPVLVCHADGRPLVANAAFERLSGWCADTWQTWQGWAEVAACFDAADGVADLPLALRASAERWRHPATLRRADGERLPVTLRAELVAARDGGVLGLILVLTDRREAARTERARAELEQAIAAASRVRADVGAGPVDERTGAAQESLLQAIVAHARLAAMDIVEASDSAPMAALLAEVGVATRRAARLVRALRDD